MTQPVSKPVFKYKVNDLVVASNYPWVFKVERCYIAPGTLQICYFVWNTSVSRKKINDAFVLGAMFFEHEISLYVPRAQQQ